MSVSKSSDLGILPSGSPEPILSPERGTPPKSIRHEFPVFVGEFIGTFMFLFLAFAGTQIAIATATVDSLGPKDSDVNLAQSVSKLIYISFAFGAGLAVNVAIFAEISGGMFNPAVSHTPHSSVPTPITTFGCMIDL